MAKPRGVEAAEAEEEEGNDDGELGEEDAGTFKDVNDEPVVEEPGNFGGESSDGEIEEGEMVVVTLDEEVASGGVDDDENGEDEERGVGGEEEGGGVDAEEGSDEGLGFGGFSGSGGFEDGEPEDVAKREKGVNREKIGGGSGGRESKKDETGAGDEVGEIGFEIREPIVGMDGEHAPFGEEDKNQTEDGVASEDGEENGADGEDEIEGKMEEGVDEIFGFFDGEKVWHNIYYTILDDFYAVF